MKIIVIFKISLLIFLSWQNNVFAQNQDNENTKLKIIELNLDTAKYQNILREKTTSIILHSGFVNLKPGESVGMHNTKDYEEMIVVLEGEGKVLIGNPAEEYAIGVGKIAYYPPDTEHNIINTGTVPLKYIYIVANTK